MSRVVIVDGLRTPFGRMGGALKTWRPTELLGLTIKNLLERNGIENLAEVAVFAGSAAGDVHTNNFARFAALYGGLPYESTATFIEMQCGSGITKDRIFHKMSDEEWDAVINTNLNGPYNMCSAVYPKMREQQYGHIVNIASVSAWGNAGQANYAASKAGLMGFTRTLAKEGGPKNVIVNAILPGTIETDMLKAVPPEKYAAYTAAVPLHRLGQPSELAAVVSFLASDDASYVTGQCITVNGGTRTT